VEKIENYNSNMDTITLGAGCFWCVEAIFQDIKGVESVVSGYANGANKNPTYKEVCTGNTGHAEVCQLVYDSEVISLSKILEVFWQVHDPTALNRQGGDVGTQYRSGIFYHNVSQKKIVVSILNKLNNDKVFDNPIVTEIEVIKSFYPAEDIHQDYFNSNGNQPYCRAVISPKVEKFKKSFAEILK
tara:strand:+ start:5786 stop:6343 length:558 start_codon:yes stop_codon:yes gene_type:complete